jgi:hypothetical protein
MDVTLIPNPDFKPETEAQKAAFVAAKKAGPVERVPMVTAVENIKLSGGMYMIKADVAPAPSVATMDLDSMATEELKLMMLRVGVTPQKQMKRPEVIKAIRLKLEEIDIADDDGSDA